MDAKELQLENERLRKLFSESQDQLARVTAELEESKVQHQATTAQFSETLQEKDRRVAALEHQIKLLLQKIRGSRQERIDPDQLLLFSMEELQQLADELNHDVDDDTADEDEKDKPKRKRGGRRRLPENLPREIHRYELSEEELVCPGCGELREEFDVASSEQLEFTPARWKVIQHDRVKYACKCCEENVAIADKPPQPIEKGVPGPGLCAHTVLSKFGDHMPLYREEDIHSRSGWMIRRSTLCGWLYSLAMLSEPLVMRMKHLLLQSKVIHTDDTGIKMLQPGAGICKAAKLWPYLGDWLHPYAVYDFTLDRARDGPLKFLSGYQGYLQADAYSGYDCIYAPGEVFEVACWIHARRYWHQAIDNDAVRANTALGFIARLSQVETQLRQSYPEQNLQGKRDFESVGLARREHSLPILSEFKSWLDSESETGRLLPKSPIRSAFTYTLNQWEALVRYSEQGYLSMENNCAERLVKYPAIGRKNFLFVGNERAGHNAAIFYSLVSSAKANGVEPFAWLQDLFTRLPYHRSGEAFAQAAAEEPVTSDELDYLLPDVWLQANPAHVWTIDEIRRKERRQKEKNRRRKRRKCC